MQNHAIVSLLDAIVEIYSQPWLIILDIRIEINILWAKVIMGYQDIVIFSWSYGSPPEETHSI